MTNTNLIAAWPKAALDSLADQLYPIFKDLLQGTFKDPSIPVEIDYRVAAPPRIILTPSEDWTAALAAEARAANVASDVPLDAVLQELANADTFTARFDPVLVGIKMSQGERQEFKLTWDATCTIDWRQEGTERFWWPRILTSRGKLDPRDPDLEELLNDVALPIIHPLINAALEKHKMKAISYGNLVFAIPRMRTYPAALATFVSLRSPTVPPNDIVIRDPRRTSVQMDSELLETFINEELRKTQIGVPKTCTEAAGWKICVWALAGLRNTRIRLLDNNVAQASMEAYGDAGVSLKFGRLPEVQFGAAISGTPLSFIRLVNEGGWIKIVCLVDTVEIKLTFYSIPEWANRLLSLVLSFLTTAIARPISAFISLFRPGIFKPDHELEFMGRKVVIKMTDMKLDTFRAPDSKIYFEAAGVGVAVKG